MAQLVFQTAFPGDLFLSVPLLRQIRKWDPKTPIVLACRPGLGDFFLKQSLVDEVIEVNKKQSDRGEGALKLLQGRQWTNVFCPHQSFRTQMWMRSLKVQKEKIGYASWFNWGGYSKTIVRRKSYPDALRQLSLLTAVNEDLKLKFDEIFKSKHFDNPKATLSDLSFVEQEIPEWASMTVQKFNSQSRTISMAPGSVWATKRWTPAGFVEVGNYFVKRGFQIQLVGSPDEKQLCQEIGSKISGSVNLAGKTSLYEMIQVLADSRALVSNDSGAMHMAALSGLPSVAVFGPTTLELGYRPWQKYARVVQTPLSCRPCGKHGAHACPVGNLKCMTEIPAARVISAVEYLISVSKA